VQDYATAASYTIKAVATNSTGCFNAASKVVTIHPKPLVDAGRDTTICNYNTYTLGASGANSYTWNSHPSLSCTNCQSPVVKPDTSVTYFVSGKTAFGCTSTDSVTVKVKQKFKMKVDGVDTVCVGETITLKAAGAEAYQWVPSFGLNNPNIPNPIAKPDTTTTYMVIGADDHNCYFDTAYTNLKVYPIPTVKIINGSNITLQVGSNVKLSTNSSPDVTKWNWTPGNALSCSTCSEPTAKPRNKITYSVTAINDGNCKAKDEVTINLLCNNANIYVPNTFSPNADGMNDVFYPRGSGVFTIKSFKVFNRWGQIVYEKTNMSANNASEGWNGIVNGQKASPDVYVYIMEVVCENNEVFPFKGDISLIR